MKLIKAKEACTEAQKMSSALMKEREERDRKALEDMKATVEIDEINKQIQVAVDSGATWTNIRLPRVFKTNDPDYSFPYHSHILYFRACCNILKEAGYGMDGTSVIDLETGLWGPKQYQLSIGVRFCNEKPATKKKIAKRSKR